MKQFSQQVCLMNSSGNCFHILQYKHVYKHYTLNAVNLIVGFANLLSHIIKKNSRFHYQFHLRRIDNIIMTNSYSCGCFAMLHALHCFCHLKTEHCHVSVLGIINLYMDISVVSTNTIRIVSIVI